MSQRVLVGTNLGNSLDAIGGETAWRNPPVTREMVRAAADRGFRIYRVPVTWNGHVGPAPGYPIDPAWLERVRQVVGWSLDAGMVTILNTHHDNELFPARADCLPAALQRFTAVWRQIARAFADVDGRLLLFEALNEPRLAGTPEEWTGGVPETRRCIGAMEQAFVDAVRAEGGRNADRTLLLTTCGAVISPSAFSGVSLPRDGHLALSLHTYDPRTFCFAEQGKPSVFRFGDAEKARVEETFACLTRYALPLGVPVYLTEFGASFKADESGARNDAEVAAFVRCVLAHARELGISCLWWDNGSCGLGDDQFALMNRITGAWVAPLTLAELLSAG